MAVFDDGVQDLLQVVIGQAAMLLLGSYLTLPGQKTLGPPPSCQVTYQYVLRGNLLRYYLVRCLLCSFSLALGVRAHVRRAGGLQHLSAKTRVTVRTLTLVAVAFSAASNLIALATFSFFLQSTTVILACLPLVDRVIVYCSFGVVGAISMYPYYDSVMVALYAAE